MKATAKDLRFHSKELLDIGATAIAYGQPLLTENYKHYKTIKDLQFNKFKP